MIAFATGCPAYAVTAPYKLASDSEDEKLEETLELSVESAVSYGLENNISIKILENKIDLALVALRNAEDNSDDLEDAEEMLDDATHELRHKKSQLNEAQDDIEKAKELLAVGIAPIAIEIPGTSLVIQPGENILDKLTEIMPVDMAIEKTAEIIAGIEEATVANQGIIDENGIALAEAEETLESSKAEFENTLEVISAKIGTKIDYNSIVELDADDAGELIITMAGVNLDVTRYAEDIYKNQIAMLIQKNYYDALYAEKMLALKKVARERGEKQYNIVKLSYENGMKAKDDFLLSKMYYDSTIISCRLAEMTYKNSIFELKKNMNLDMNRKITLSDSILNEVTEESLEDGLKSGLTNRIEIQQILGQKMIYELNEDILKSKYKRYRKKPEAYKEAILLKEGSEFELEITKAMLKSEINQSYESMVGAGEMQEAANELIENAQEVVAISNLKYEQGYGAENALLKEMNLQESSGTIIELIAAQEKLADVESQVALIRYSYTMAKIKYFNDAGILVY
jgi:hypothetical protein